MSRGKSFENASKERAEISPERRCGALRRELTGGDISLDLAEKFLSKMEIIAAVILFVT